MVERRKYPRYKFTHRVVYSDVSKTYKVRSEGKTRTEDVSRGGVRMKLNDVIDAGKTLSMRIYNSLHEDPVDAEARVVWSKKMPGDSAAAGLAFTRIGWVESDKLFKPAITDKQ